MCLLALLRGVDPAYPLWIANNRDEFRSRPAAPPGLWVGERRRVLSPRDKEKGGTWMGINDVGMFAGLTNLVDRAPDSEAPTRGVLPHRALDHGDLDAAAADLAVAIPAGGFRPFQLLLADARRALLLVWDGAQLQLSWPEGDVLLLTNEHRLGELRLPALDAAAATGLGADQRVGLLEAMLSAASAPGEHRVLKAGGEYGTVSSAVLALPAAGAPLLWRYAHGQPDLVGYKNYGNLQRRLSAPS